MNGISNRPSFSEPPERAVLHRVLQKPQMIACLGLVRVDADQRVMVKMKFTKRGEPVDDLITKLAEAEIDGDRRQRDQASASMTMPTATMPAAISRGRAGPSPNQISPIIAAKITEVSRSADTMPSGALLLA